MHLYKTVYLLSLLCNILISCNGQINTTNKKQAAPVTAGLNNIIPKPVYTKAAGGAFQLTASASIIVENISGEVFSIGQYLADKLKKATGFKLKVSAATEKKMPGTIYLKIVASDSLNNNEAYTLNIAEDSVVLSSTTAAGLFCGVQSLRQLFSPAIELGTLKTTSWYIATGTIKDYPLYAYRGAMLDVARHFFSVEDVKRCIDLMAYYKMNVMHLHLSDDQGWRIEIKAWPKLTSYGGSTQVGGGKGVFFYTQEQYKDIVAYAGSRYITVIPEIDMPGHTNAALASYPELNCNPKDKNPQLYTGTKVGFSTLCTQNENVYKFVDDVITELAAITPGPYIHIGGDESHVTEKADYIKFIDRVQGIVIKHGKQVIGWDEIALSTLQPNSIAQYWANGTNSVNAVKKGAKVIMSPAKKTYLDMKYDSTTTLGLNWAGYIEVDTGYIWTPATMVNGIASKDIIGIEAPLWTETVTNLKELEFMVFPRLPGYAEIGWSPAEARNWEEYKIRLGKHGSRMKAMGINFYKSKKVPWVQ